MNEDPRVLLVSIPLMARSGVYRSTHDLVRAARELGHEWSAIIGVRPSAAGAPLRTSGVHELEFVERGRAGIAEVRRIVESAAEACEADVIVSLISQSDVAVSGSEVRHGRRWVAWVRGKPWPAAGEQHTLRRVLLRAVETRALRQADEVWATTSVLAADFASARSAEIIPAGVPSMTRTSWGVRSDLPLVWAGRLDIDKRPELFVEIVRESGHSGRVYGEGPLAAELRAISPDSVEWAGWSDATSLWVDASIFVGTSGREAFGRSAVEAAGAGLPVIIGSNYGAAPLLFTSPDLADLCVIDSARPADWARAVRRLLNDAELRATVSEHVCANARQLTIESSVRRAVERLRVLVRESTS